MDPETELIGRILEAIVPTDKGFRGCLSLLNELALLAISLFLVSAILLRIFGEAAVTVVVIFITLALALYAAFYIYRRLRSPTQSSVAPDDGATSTHVPARLTVEVASEFTLGKWALVISLAMAGLGAILLYDSFFRTESPDSAVAESFFWTCFICITVGCITATCLSILALWGSNNQDGYAKLSLTMSASIFAIFAFWHFLALGLAGVYAPCLIDTIALILAGAVLVIRRPKTSKPV